MNLLNPKTRRNRQRGFQKATQFFDGHPLIETSFPEFSEGSPDRTNGEQLV